MDFRYRNIPCPICQKEFQETDDIVICPECGAPYHRACIKEKGGCIYTELHQQGKEWEPIRRPNIDQEEQKYDGYASRRCSHCGTVNPPDKLFCEICGNQLDRPNAQPNDATAGPPPQEPFFAPGYNYTTPFGGLDPEETVNDVSVKELALYVRENTPYFLPKIKDIQNGKRSVSWNWSAFILDFYYLYYRKMWGLAILSTVIMLLLSVPSLIYNLDVMLYSFTGAQGSSLIESLGLNAAGLYNLCNFLSVISLAYKLFLGMFFNKFYANKAVRDIKKIRDQHGQEQDYHMLLTAKGSVSRLYFGLAVVITMVLSTAVSLIVVNLFITTI